MGGSCFEQLGAAPAPSDRELHELDNFWPLHAQSPQQQSAAAAAGTGGGLFELDGKAWPTAEHCFQAAKYPQNERLQEEIRTAALCTGPGGCFQRGNAGAGLRADWEAVKVDMMYAANRAKYEQNPELRELLVNTRGRIRARGARDMWATWNEVLLERLREELRQDVDRDSAVLEARVAMMAAYQSAACQPGERALRAVAAVTGHAAKRELLATPGDEGGGAPASLTIAGCRSLPDGAAADCQWINGEYWVDPLQPLVNGQPHYMIERPDDSESGCGHLFLGLRAGQARWVLDEELDENEIGGTLTLPAAAPHAFPSGTHQWVAHGGATVSLTIS